MPPPWNIAGSTFALEGDPALVAQLERLVDALGGSPLHLLAETASYHAAAVVASNYMVTLAALASDLLVRARFTPDASNTALPHLLPLMHGTLDNLETSRPARYAPTRRHWQEATRAQSPATCKHCRNAPLPQPTSTAM